MTNENNDFEEEWNFDFSDLESDNKSDEFIDNSMIDPKIPHSTILTSRFTNDMIELKKIGLLSVNISKLGTHIASRKKDINLIKEYYGNLNELWACIRVVAGKKIMLEIDTIDKKCIQLINSISSSNIPEDLFKYLLLYRDVLYRFKQIINLGISTERRNKSSARKKAQRLIVE